MGRLDEEGTKMRLLKFVFVACLLFAGSPIYAHVGSPGVVYQGKAGPYNITVNVNPPDVIPGTATTSVYIDNQQVYHVYLQPVYWYAGDKGSPKADEALPVKDIPGQYQGLVWLMQTGVASMRVTVDGPLGKGSAVIPVMAVSTAQRTMPASLDWMLAGLGLLLVVLMITIIGASVSDGIADPGTERKKSMGKRYRAMAITAVVLLAILFGGSAWWNGWSANYRKFMYKAPLAHTSVLFDGKQMVLKLGIDTAWLRKNSQSMSYLVPDHGKLMHLFLIRENTADVFAHLHPSRVDSIDYEAPLPDLPPGRYFVFGDIVRWNGFMETISDTLTIPKANELKKAPTLSLFNDADDTYVLSNSINDLKNPVTGKVSLLVCGKPGTAMKLADGSTAFWQHQINTPFEAGRVYPLTFMIKDPSGQPAKLEPYMGMTGHAVVFKYDGSVYVHLHPVGTYSMTSQQIIQSRIKGNGKVPLLPDATHFRDSIDQLIGKIRTMSEDQRNTYLNGGMNMQMADSAGHRMDGMVTFPYAFPSPGNYRIWIQMKRNGKILNSAFDAVVE